MNADLAAVHRLRVVQKLLAPNRRPVPYCQHHRYDGLQEPTILTGDQDAVRRANALVRADEEEEAYWASQRNANSTKSAAPAPAPKKELTAKQIALQRRRKTKNKGAQHHQKDRAARKV